MATPLIIDDELFARLQAIANQLNVPIDALIENLLAYAISNAEGNDGESPVRVADSPRGRVTAAHPRNEKR